MRNSNVFDAHICSLNSLHCILYGCIDHSVKVGCTQVEVTIETGI